MQRIKIQNKILLALVAAILLVAPFAVLAVNDVTIDGPVNFEFNVIDAPFAPTIIVGQQTGTGTLTELTVNTSDMIIKIDPLSTVRFDKTSGSTYFKVTQVSGTLDDYTLLPLCPDSYIDITGGAATVELKIEMTTIRPGCLPPIDTGPGGQVEVYPYNYSVSINNGATCTISSSVTLNLASENAYEVMISNTSDFSGAVWQVFNFSSKIWPLEPGNGNRTVYVQYKSGTGSISPVLSASIAVNLAGCEVVPPPPPDPSLSTGNYSANEAMNSALTISMDKDLSLITTAPLCVAESLIKLPSDNNSLTQVDSTVYYCGVDGRRYVFPNPSTYFSWYPTYDIIQIISAEDMAEIPLGSKNVTIRPGTRLVKFTTSYRVYAVAQDGVLRWVVDEATAVALYGVDWNDWVVDISDTFFSDYTFGDDITLEQVTPGMSLPSSSMLRISVLANTFSF
jgi:hypothetical protein